MNGPIKMYQTKPIVRHDEPVQLPTCMYEIKNIYGPRNCAADPVVHVSSTNKNLDITEQNNQEIPGMADLQARQEKILKQLADLKKQMLNIKSELNISNVTSNKTTVKSSTQKIEDLPNIVIHAGPNYPPHSLALVQKLLQDQIHLSITIHQHSSVPVLPKNAKELSDILTNFKPKALNLPKMIVRLIWNNVEADMELLVSIVPILGEVNALRYLSRCFTNVLSYESDKDISEIDSLLDISHELISTKSTPEKTKLVQYFVKSLGKSNYLMGKNKITVADVAAVSALKQVASSSINGSLSQWVKRCEAA